MGVSLKEAVHLKLALQERRVEQTKVTQQKCKLIIQNGGTKII